MRKVRCALGVLVTPLLVALTAGAARPAGAQGAGFVNEVVVPGMTTATTIAFLPDGRLLIGELGETIWVVQPGANAPDPTPFLQLDGSGLGAEQGLMDIRPDPGFAVNGYYYIFHTRTQSGRNRLSRFTACRQPDAAGKRARAVGGRLPGRGRAPRRCHRVRQRREALLHLRRSVLPRPSPVAQHLPRQSAADPSRRHHTHGQSLLRRAGSEQGPDLGARPSQSLPHVDRSRDRSDVHRRRRGQRGELFDRGDRSRRCRRELRLADCAKGAAVSLA